MQMYMISSINTQVVFNDRYSNLLRVIQIYQTICSASCEIQICSHCVLFDRLINILSLNNINFCHALLENDFAPTFNCFERNFFAR